MTEKNSTVKTIYIGASIRGATPEQKVTISSHVNTVCKIIRARGYAYYVDKSMLDPTVNVTNPKLTVPRQFYNGISDSLVEKISGLRHLEKGDSLRYDIAMCRWTDHLLETSSGCIWLHDRSQTGLGIEVLRALYELERQCLVLYSTKNITSLLKGRTTRLLTTRRWNDDGVKFEIESFLDKIEGGYDKSHRVLLSAELEHFAKQQARLLSHGKISEYVRELIVADREKVEKS